ncbi:MAG TPA: sigma-70 family RNA polymerase sigma factor [Blastocatellia bacterium]|nr:sigma-70 family RNA polymerase sigma factor [Blastocatellia bacterium]
MGDSQDATIETLIFRLSMMSNQTTPTDEELLRRMMAGDEEAFVTLYRRRHGGVYRFALRMCGSESVAEDVTQEVFIALMRKPDLYDPGRGALSTWLYGIARNQVLRRISHDRPYVAISDGEDDGEPLVYESLIASDDPLGDLTRGEMIESVRQAVLALPEHYREVVVLCELHEMNYAEAAQVIGCPIGTVRSRLNRARALLVEKLKSVRSSVVLNAADSELSAEQVVAARYAL